VSLAVGAILIALVCAVALPDNGRAAGSATPWNFKAAPEKTPGGVVCAKPANVAGAKGYAAVRMCLKYYRSTGETYYYQGVLELTYHARVRGGSDNFGGQSMSVLGSTGKATGIHNCPSVTWTDGQKGWCYSPTIPFRGSDKLYGKGDVIDPAGGHHAVWSPVFPTVAPGNQPAPTSKEYAKAMALGFDKSTRPEGGKREVIDSGVKTADDGVIVAKFFIPSRYPGTLGHGDNRSWSKDPNTATQSRVYLTWDVATGKVSVTASPSRLRGVPGRVHALPISLKPRCPDVRSSDGKRRDTSDFHVGRVDTGLLVCMSALNSAAHRGGPLSWSIDGVLSIVPNTAAVGGYRVVFNGNGFPAIEMYYYPRTSSSVRGLFLRRVDPAGLGLRGLEDSRSYWWCLNGNQTNIHQKSTCTFDARGHDSSREGDHFDTNDGDPSG
jgi:hypothetical protein